VHRQLDSVCHLPLINTFITDAHEPAASWSSLITLLRHTCTCTSQSCRVRTSPSYVSALRTHLSWRWWPILKRLRLSKSETSAKAQSEWMILGRMAGLEEVTERNKHERGESVLGCWWAECASLVESPDPALNAGLRKCSGCKKALYCTNECQTR
jgi:MYND finger